MHFGGVQPMSDYRAFSNDRLWWWNGTGWMPTRAPDGRSAVWSGSHWVARGGLLHWGVVVGIAVALGVIEFVWVLVAVFLIIVSDVNARYEAGGRVGSEDIFDSPLTLPILLTFLVVPIIVTVLTAANIRRHWWVGVLVLGGWPAIAIAILMFVTPATGKLEDEAVLGVVVLALIAIGWLVHSVVFRSWHLSPDGHRWVRGGRSFPTHSSDGHWRWDGRTWLPAETVGSGAL